ncbi:P-loop NTPase fold protein [Nitrosospira sp. Nsp14]|uniref:P-loop NTPase fold protein n=1 Tax=Nitrosospira sp. Nsp14 TaxID=1855333 RepID=UPI0015A692FE|nr:P-loop NTPase fold protein [Nitrosospira sp. Nsp14]
MKLITPPLDISETEGFKQDVLGREAYGKALLDLIIHSRADELVISLDGQWGEGKTTFIKMWRGLLKEVDVPNIYIDAFANDYVDDAFIAIAVSAAVILTH